MGIPSELISQLVKINNNTAKKKTESTVYGETVERDGSIYVRFDGSELLTPVSNTANVGPGERVIVLIKNHTATITGNLTSPAARVVTDPVTQKKTVENIDLDGVDSIRVELIEVKELLGEKVSVGELEGEFAAIDELQADNVSIKARLTAAEVDVSNLQADNANIKEKLTAAEGDISTLKTDNVTIKEKLSANEVSVKTLEADNVSVKGKIEAAEADISTLKADNVTINGKLEANDADIKTLKTDKLDATAADIKYATIENLNAQKGLIDDLSVNKLDANSATITDLQAGLADIDTLIFGSASGTSIQTSFANSVIAQLGNAQIKSAMIDSVSASKITAGDIITNNIKVKSNDGKLLISDETIQISDDTRVRVQIGKDAANDYSINIWDDEGNLMFSKGGITDSAIKEAIIRNDMVKDDANISAKKLDIDSLFDEVNGSSKTIKSSKIMVDEKNQTLDVAFTSMTSDLNGAKDDISSQGTQISAIQGQITSKVWQQDIETAVDGAATTLNTKYSELKQSTDGVALTVAGHTTELTNKAGKGEVTDVSNRVTNVEANLEGFKSTVSSTYTTKEDFNNLEIGGRNLIAGTDDTTEYVSRGDGSTYYDAFSKVTIDPPTGTEYVVSFDAKAEAAIDIQCFFYSPNTTLTSESSTGYIRGSGVVDGHCVVSVTTEWKRYWVKWTQSATNSVKEIIVGRNYNTANVYIRAVKLEAGNKATDWTPAPEDVEDDISDLSGRMENAETKIEQKADSITLSAYASKTDLENGMNAVKQWKSEQAIDLRDTSVYSESNWYPVVGARMPGAYYLYIQVYANLHGECKPSWCTHDDGFVVDFGVKTKASGWGATDMDTVILEDTYKFIAYGEASPVSYDQCNASSEPILWLRGGGKYRVRTDYACLWTPYPGGYTWQSGQYADAFHVSSFRPTPLGNHVASAEETKASLDILSDRITSNVTETDGLKSRMSTVEQTAEGLTVSLEELEIGGRNLLPASAFVSDNVFLNSTEYVFQNNGIRVSAPYMYSYFGITLCENLVIGETYTLSCRAAVSPTANYAIFRFGSTKHVDTNGQYGSYTLTTDELKIVKTFEATSNLFTMTLYPYVSGTTTPPADTWMYAYDIKLEKGNKATDWTPAPEDVQNGIDNASKTATNFLSYDATNGLQVGNKSSGSWSGYRTQILSDAFNILDADGMVCASYGKNLIELGKGNTNAIISLCGGKGTIRSVYDEWDGEQNEFLKIDSDCIKIHGDLVASLCSTHENADDLGNGVYDYRMCKAYVEPCALYGIHLGCSDTHSEYEWKNTSASIDITHVSGITMLADSITSTGRNSALFDTVQGNITIRPGLGGNLLLEPANDLILDPGSHTKVRSKLFISSAEKAAYNDGVTGWYFGDDGTAHVTHVDGASISFHYGNSSTTSSIIQETDYGVISINGMKFGVNRLLWNGAFYMQGSHAIALSEYVTDQANGIVLLFSSYSNGAAQNSGWNAFFVPKYMTGTDMVFTMSTSKFGTIATKKLNIDYDTIYGSDDNIASGTSCGITYNNKAFVLRYVIGV